MQTLPGCTDVLRASGASQSRREPRRTNRRHRGRRRLPWISRPAITTAGEQSCRISEALLVPQGVSQLSGTLVFLVSGCHFASIFPAHSAAKHCPLAAVCVDLHTAGSAPCMAHDTHLHKFSPPLTARCPLLSARNSAHQRSEARLLYAR